MPNTTTPPGTTTTHETWNEEIDELKRRHQFAETMGGPEAVARQHGAGRLTIRERIVGLTDQNSFQEVGKLTGQGHYVDGRLESVTAAP